MSNIICQLDAARHLAIITLNRPEKHNALAADDVNSLIESLISIKEDKHIRALIITGSGEQTFCAGAALEQLHDDSLRGDAFSTLARTIVELDVPSICLLNGSVYGGGVELALACDFRVATAQTKLQVPVAKLGLCYSSYGLQLYHAQLGLSLSKRILTTAEKFTAKQLLELGFLDALHPTLSAAQEYAYATAARIAALAPLAVQSMRASLNDLALNQFNLEHAQQREMSCLTSQDKREGFAAIIAKRPAQFQNK